MKYLNYKIILVVALLICSVWVYFPGSYSIDSWNMYYQTISGNYNDWHSPMLVFAWKLIYVLTGRTYFTLYLVQMLLYWLFVYLLLVKINKNNYVFWAGIILAVFWLFIAQYISKDTHNSLSWGLASLLLIILSRNKKKSIALTLCILLLLLYGFLVRINAILAFLPMLYLWVDISFKQALFKRVCITAVIFVVAVVGNNLVTYNVLHAKKTYPQYKLKLLDVIGISKLTGDNYLPKEITGYKLFNTAKVYSQYSPATIDHIYWPPDSSKSMLPYPNAQLNTALDSCWKKAIEQHPLVYLKNRGAGFLNYLRINKRVDTKEYWNVAIWIDPVNPLHLTNKHTPFVMAIINMYESLRYTPLFEPWFWLAINIILMVYYYWKYYKNGHIDFYNIVAFVQLSAVIYILSQFFIYQVDTDFRYTYWNVFAALIGIVGFFQSPAKQKSPTVNRGAFKTI